MRDEVLSREIFATLTKAEVLITDRRKEYNEFRPHSAFY
ncbi:MAG: transposase [Chloroflexi bacterium]|nr:transposase [Chloroflexota bacterium]